MDSLIIGQNGQQVKLINLGVINNPFSKKVRPEIDLKKNYFNNYEDFETLFESIWYTDAAVCNILSVAAIAAIRVSEGKILEEKTAIVKTNSASKAEYLAINMVLGNNRLIYSDGLHTQNNGKKKIKLIKETEDRYNCKLLYREDTGDSFIRAAHIAARRVLKAYRKAYCAKAYALLQHNRKEPTIIEVIDDYKHRKMQKKSTMKRLRNILCGNEI